MKIPLPLGSPIDHQRMTGWVSIFTAYRHSVNEQRIDRWLSQFSDNHRDIAARVLDCVDLVSNEQVSTGFRSSLQSIEGWNVDIAQRVGKWRFIAFSVSAGQSGDSMLHRFRHANRLTGKQFNDQFIHKSEILSSDLGPEDTVIFVDDFSGTGSQVVESWNENISELVPNTSKVYLLLVASTQAARELIERETGMTVVSSIELNETDNIFSNSCAHFTDAEKGVLLQYCETSNRRFPKGYGECGLLLVFAHNCPNNSIPILHSHNHSWEGLFRRYD